MSAKRDADEAKLIMLAFSKSGKIDFLTWREKMHQNLAADFGLTAKFCDGSNAHYKVPEPPAPTETELAAMDSVRSEAKKGAYQKALEKQYEKTIAMQDDLAKCFARMERYISPEVRSLAEGTAGWKDTKGEDGATVLGVYSSRDPLKLLLHLETLVGTGSKGSAILDSYNSKQNYDKIEMGDMSLGRYRTAFEQAVKYLTLAKCESLPSESEMAVHFLQRLNHDYNGLLHALDLDLIKSPDAYPKTLELAMAMATQYERTVLAKRVSKPRLALPISDNASDDDGGHDSESCLPVTAKLRGKSGRQNEGKSEGGPKSVKVPREILDAVQEQTHPGVKCFGCERSGHPKKDCKLHQWKKEQWKLYGKDVVFCLAADVIIQPP